MYLQGLRVDLSTYSNSNGHFYLCTLLFVLVYVFAYMRKNAQESLRMPVPCGSGALYTYKGHASPAKTVPVVWLGFLDSGTLESVSSSV